MLKKTRLKQSKIDRLKKRAKINNLTNNFQVDGVTVGRLCVRYTYFLFQVLLLHYLVIRQKYVSLVRVGVFVDDGFGLLFVREDVVDPVDVEGFGLQVGQRETVVEAGRLLNHGQRFALVLGHVLLRRGVDHTGLQQVQVCKMKHHWSP